MEQERKAALEETLRKQGLSLTSQRRVILEALLGRRDHPTAEQVYESVRDRLPGLSRATVYRVLDTLVEAGAARKVFHPGAVVRFDPMTERHHHLACQICGNLLDLDASAIKDLRLPDVRKSGFTITDYSINFTGVCSGCRESSKTGGK
jgi:Fur family peroxide stress response transcriptional regulator